MEKSKVFLLGMLVAIVLMFLIGAGKGQIGRYQISSLGGGRSETFVVDTTTGVTKQIDDRYDMDVPFEEIKPQNPGVSRRQPPPPMP